MTDKTSVLIADDHPLFRKGLRQAIEEDAALTVVAEAGDGAAALRQIREMKPDVAVLDIDMPGMTGLQVARAVRDEGTFVAVVILTVYREEDMFNEAIDLGVRGYVLKETAGVEILDALKSVSMGKYYISPAISGHLAGRTERARQLLKEKPSISSLTATERKVLRLIAQGKTSKDIGEEMHVSFRTVETHRYNISTKLNIHGSHSLVKFAIDHRSFLQE
jgi:DNA-binding NarL/FixJ family response regulator